MLAYWLLFGLCALAALPGETWQKRNSIGWVAAGVLLCLMIGLRRDVGGDWGTYQQIFNRIKYFDSLDVLKNIDPGFRLLNLAAARLGLGVWAVNLACAAIFTLGLVAFCRDQSSPFLALLVAVPYLIIVVAMGYTRQAAALGLVMLALVYYFRAKMVRVTICAALAVTLHRSAIIIIPLLAMASSRKGFLTVILFAITTALAYWLLVSQSLDRLMTNYVHARYNSAGAGIRIAMNLVPASLYLLSSDRFALSREEKRLWAIFSVGSFAALVLFLTTPSSTAVDRLSLYLIPLQVSVLSRAPSVFSAKQLGSISLKACVIAYSLIVQFTWLNYADNARAWIPYDNYLLERPR
jgi:hypothetical protein